MSNKNIKNGVKYKNVSNIIRKLRHNANGLYSLINE